MSNIGQQLLSDAGQGIKDKTTPNRFVGLLEARRVPPAVLGQLTADLSRLVASDGRSFSHLATRFPDAAAGEFFRAMAEGEEQALALLQSFAAAQNLDADSLASFASRPLGLAYPAFISQVALCGSRSDMALALLANVEESGATYARIADALHGQYGFPESALAHFRFFAETPPEILEQAHATLESGIAAGDSVSDALDVALIVHTFEGLFWHDLAAHVPADDGDQAAVTIEA
ncbi:hypothetical protein [Streptomyces sp. NPDC057889]|uniref:hypothetical protein n=1 Tax=unclassified Streptomyces TaxID=2593676 RepID=UPI0036CC4F67